MLMCMYKYMYVMTSFFRLRSLGIISMDRLMVSMYIVIIYYKLPKMHCYVINIVFYTLSDVLFSSKYKYYPYEKISENNMYFNYVYFKHGYTEPFLNHNSTTVSCRPVRTVGILTWDATVIVSV